MPAIVQKQRRRRRRGKPSSPVFSVAIGAATTNAFSTARALSKGFAVFKSRVDTEDIAGALKDKSVDQTVERIPFELLPDDLKETNVRILTTTVDGADVARKFMQPSLARDLRFRINTPRMREIVDNQVGELITDITARSQASIRDIMQRSLSRGLSRNSTAKLIKDTIGLTEKQTQAVENFRISIENENFGLLTQQQRSILAPRMFREQRDKIDLANPKVRARFIRIAMEKRIDTVVGRYSDRLLNQRSMNIARTESLRAVNEGIREQWEQAADDGLINRDKALKQWVIDPTTACNLCRPLSGITVPMTEQFQTQIGSVEGPPLHPQCNCISVLIVGPDDVSQSPEGQPPPAPDEPFQFTPPALPSFIGDPKRIISKIADFTTEQIDTALWYKNAGHRAVNRMLRTGIGGVRTSFRKITDSIRSLDSMIASSRLTQDVTLFRGLISEQFGLQDPLEQLLGKTFKINSFWSTTTEVKIAEKFANATKNKDSIIANIIVRRGQSALDMGLFTTKGKKAREKEILLPRGLKLKVIGFRIRPREALQAIRDIYLEVVK